MRLLTGSVSRCDTDHGKQFIHMPRKMLMLNEVRVT